MFRSTTAVVFVTIPSLLTAQPSIDTVNALHTAHQQYVQLGARHGDEIFPGFRPDTIPLLIVLPGQGAMLFGWRGTLPVGYNPHPVAAHAGWRAEATPGAASTAIQLAGRPVAQVVAASLEPVDLVPLGLHEAFHVFQGVARAAGRRFGAGENAMLVSSYPVFNLETESLFALEGRVLHAALAATSKAKQRELTQQFIGVRRWRHRLAGPSVAEFDQASELNEGLAQYVLVRALELLATQGGAPQRALATKQLQQQHEQLRNLTGNDRLSLRLRFYHTGPAIATLLDRIGDVRWKRELLDGNWSLQDLLALVSGADRIADAARDAASKRFDLSETRRDAASGMERLRAQRRRLMDSVLSLPGVQLVVSADSLPSRNFSSCGFDPQNHLQVTATLRLQMRWWRPCSGGPTYVEFNVPSVHDEQSGMLRAVLGALADVKVTAADAPIVVQDGVRHTNLQTLRIVAPRVTINAVRADVLLQRDTLFVYPKGPARTPGS